MANCSNCGKYMDGFGSICGLCKDNAKIQQNQSDMQRQLEANARQAKWAAEESLRESRSASYEASRHHDEAMQAEADRLEELRKQTQILLEGQITNEEAYQRGFDLEDENLNLLLTEDGRVYWEIYEPYLVARLNAAYEKGAQDRLEKEFSSNFPGLEYMKQEAFGHGYAGSRNCSIVYLHHLPNIYPAKLNILSDTGLVPTTNPETGKLEWQWLPTFMSGELNDAYALGAQKFLDEQNTAELVAERLEKAKANIRQAEESANKQVAEDLLKQQILQRSRKKRLYLVIAILLLGAVGGFGYWDYIERSGSYESLRKDLLGAGWKMLPARDKNIGNDGVQYCTEDLLCSVEFINPKNSKMIKVVRYRVCSSMINNCYSDNKPDGFEKVVAVEDISLKVANKNFKDMKSRYEK